MIIQMHGQQKRCPNFRQSKNVDRKLVLNPVIYSSFRVEDSKKSFKNGDVAFFKPYRGVRSRGA